jgi:hypothetical protein
MLKIGISTPPEVGQRWTLMRQCGVECAVGGISLRPIASAEPEEQPWSYTSLSKAKAAVAEEIKAKSNDSVELLSFCEPDLYGCSGV